MGLVLLFLAFSVASQDYGVAHHALTACQDSKTFITIALIVIRCLQLRRLVESKKLTNDIIVQEKIRHSSIMGCEAQ